MTSRLLRMSLLLLLSLVSPAHSQVYASELDREGFRAFLEEFGVTLTEEGEPFLEMPGYGEGGQYNGLSCPDTGNSYYTCYYSVVARNPSHCRAVALMQGYWMGRAMYLGVLPRASFWIEVRRTGQRVTIGDNNLNQFLLTHYDASDSRLYEHAMNY